MLKGWYELKDKLEQAFHEMGVMRGVLRVIAREYATHKARLEQITASLAANIVLLERRSCGLGRTEGHRHEDLVALTVQSLLQRHTPLMSDKTQAGLRWGSIVHGVEHYGWVKLTRPEDFKGLWLPIRVEGVEVLRREIRSASSAASVPFLT